MESISSEVYNNCDLRSPHRGGLAPSLDNYSQNTTKHKEWSRQQKRIYHRIMSLLRYWFSFDYAVLWFCLTSSPNSDFSKLNYHFQVLKQKIEREYGFRGIEHLIVKTKEGHGVIHGFLAWKPPRGVRKYRFYIPQDWLSVEWERIHGAKIVWISRVRAGEKSRKRISRYCVSQYCVNQEALVRVSWSWKRGLGGALVKTWNMLRRTCLDCGKSVKTAVALWNKLLAGFEVKLLDVWGNLLLFKPPPCLGFEEKGPPSLLWWFPGGA